MPRPCAICSSSEKTRVANEMITAGRTDKEVGAAVGCATSSANRHRLNHILPVARALTEVVDRGAQPRLEREQTLAAAQEGKLDPAGFLSVAQLTEDLRSTAQRLERVTSAAEHNNHLSALAPLVGQQHRNIELRGRLGGHLVPKQLTAAENMPQFNLVINLPGQVQRISGTDIHPDAKPVLDLPAVALPAPVEGNEDVETLVEKVFAPAPEVEPVKRGRPRRHKTA